MAVVEAQGVKAIIEADLADTNVGEHSHFIEASVADQRDVAVADVIEARLP